MDIENWSMDELRKIIKEYTLNDINEQEIEDNQNEDLKLENEKIDKDRKINNKKENDKLNLKNKKEISFSDFNNCDSIKVKIIPFNYEYSDYFSKLKAKNVTNMIFYIYINQFNLKIKRKYSDFEWLYYIITNNYKYKIPYELPITGTSKYSILGFNVFDENDIADKLSKMIEFLLNIPNIKNKKIIFDFVTIEKDNIFQEKKKIYEKIDYHILSENDLENKITNKQIEKNNIFGEIPILSEEDYKNEFNDDIKIKSSGIKKAIINFLSKENYIELRNYCYKCLKNEANKEVMLMNLDLLYKEGKNNIYDLIDKYEILKTLMLINSKNYINYYQQIVDIIKRINNVKDLSIDEYFTRIDKFSEIIKEATFDINFLEKLAEENIKNMKIFLDIYYKGEERNAVDPFLKEKYVNLLKDYQNVIIKKYKVDEKKILDKLKELKNKNDMEELNIFIGSLNEHEQLYYDLLVQSILEAPESDSELKSWLIPIVKILKETFGSIIGTAIASLTGSKILTAISASVGTVVVIKDIADLYIKKNYFSKDGEFRKLYHINQRNSYDKRWNIIKRSIKEKYRRIVNPIKKGFYNLLDKKILGISEKTKIGFEKNEEGNIKDEANIFIDNIFNKFKEDLKEKLKLKHYQNLIKMKKTFREKTKTKSYEKIKEESDKKENDIKDETEKKITKLQKDYEEFKDNSFIEKKIQSVYSLVSDIKDAFKFVISFGGNNKEKSQNDIMMKIINNLRYKQYLEELDDIEKFNKKKLFKILKNEIRQMCELTNKDNDIFNTIKENYKKEKERIKNYSKEIVLEDNKQEKVDNNDKDKKRNDNDSEIPLLKEKDDFLLVNDIIEMENTMNNFNLHNIII